MRDRLKPKYNVISVRVTDQEYAEFLNSARSVGKTNLSAVMREGIQLWLMNNQEHGGMQSSQ